MKVYRYLFLNRIRENIRLVKNLYAALIGLLIAAIWAFWIFGWPLYLSITAEPTLNKNFFAICMGILLFFSLKKNVGRVSPQIIVKPMTLFCFDDSKLQRLFALKFVVKVIKYTIFSAILSFITCGSIHVKAFFSCFFSYSLCLMIGTLTAWGIYNSENKVCIILLRITALAGGVISAFCLKAHILIIINLIIISVLLVYCNRFLEINYYKYNDDLVYYEKVLEAQNNNNVILLKQYSKEKLVRKIPHTRKKSWILDHYPLMWKAFISISRTGRTPIIIGVILFTLSFTIYTIPFFWEFPMLEIKEVRYLVLLMGIYSIAQISIREFSSQIIGFMEKQANGLFLPVKEKKIIFQFALFPWLYITVISIVISALLKGKVYYNILYWVFLSVYLLITMTLSVKNRKLLSKLYVLFSVSVFAISILFLL